MRSYLHLRWYFFEILFVKCTHILLCIFQYYLYNVHTSSFADNLPSFSPHSALIKDLSVSTVKKVKVLIKHISHRSEYPKSAVDPKPSSLWQYSGQPGILQWTPDRHTPDTVYYQCYTHRYQGLIRLLDTGAIYIGNTTHTQMFMFSYMDIQCYSFQIPGLENQRSWPLWPIEQKQEVGIENGCLPHVWKSRCSGRSSRSCSYRSNIENGGTALIEIWYFKIYIHMESIHYAIFWAFEDPGGQNIE